MADAPGPWTAFPPDYFDDYQVIQPLGAGGMGAVFLGHDCMLDRRVALKFIAGAAPDPTSRVQFLQEARALARLHHPNVVGVYRIGEVDGRPYLAYELVDGEPLHRLPWPLPWRRALRLAVGVARGLAAVHAAGVLHRDLKPANIVVAPGDVAKLIDFGLASRLDDGIVTDVTTGAWLPAMSEAATEAGAGTLRPLAGTPMYMAPELWTGAAPSPASDVYALGLLLWQALAGELPHDGLASEALAVAIRARVMPSLRSVRADVPGALAELVDQCVARDPRDRPASASVRDRLETVLAVYAPLVDGAAEERVEQAAADELAGSFARATIDPDLFSRRFYERVFELEPGLRALFPADLTAQRLKLVSTLQTVVRNVRAPERLVPMLEELGERHHQYGVSVRNFDVVGQALLATLAELEGEAWAPATEALWTRAYQHIAEHMTRGLTRAAHGSAPRATPPLTRVPLAPPEPRFATSGDVAIAHQVLGTGPIDLLVLPGWASHLEHAWLEPGYALMMSRLAQRARVVVIDRRGTGLSDRAPRHHDVADHVADALAVLDAVGAERPVVLGLSDAAAVAAALAATHPERVRGLVLLGGTPAHAGPAARVDEVCEAIRTRWGEPLFVDEQAPSRATDGAFRAWWARLLRSAISPTMAAAFVRASAALDVRPLLAAIGAPTLVLHRVGDRAHVVAGASAFAAGIRGARHVELPGADHLPFVGEVEPLLRELEQFVRDAPTVFAPPARVVTVLAIHAEGGSAPAAADGALRAALEREHGVIVRDEEADGAPVLVATFDLPAPALRSLAAAPAGVRAAVHTATVTGPHGERAVLEHARQAAEAAAAGKVVLDAVAAALTGGATSRPLR